MTIKNPLMRYHGAKFRLAQWIMGFFPEHYTYVEPFGGAAGVLLQKEASISEVYNDLDSEIHNVFEILKNKTHRTELETLLTLTPYSRREFELSYQPSDDPIEQARRTIVRAFQGFGSAGATKGSAGFRVDSARKYGTAAHLWAKYPDQIQQFGIRLEAVVLENKPALSVIENHDRADTLFYIDPPYTHDSRVMGNRTYKHEMDDNQHEELLIFLNSVKGFVVLSGYDTDLYNDMLIDWEKHSKKARISAGRGTGTRIENVWLNPACSEKVSQKRLFA